MNTQVSGQTIQIIQYLNVLLERCNWLIELALTPDIGVVVAHFSHEYGLIDKETHILNLYNWVLGTLIIITLISSL